MKWNETKKGKTTEKENFEGGQALEPSTPEMGLYKVVINNLLEDTYYEEDEESLKKVINRFDKCANKNPEFVLKLANYARNEMYLREVPQLLLVLSANEDSTKEFAREYAPSIISRADEPATVIAMQLGLFGKPIPKPLKKGIEKALHQFDRYQFSKYQQSRRDVSMVDVFNLVHPKPKTKEEEDIFESIVRGELSDYPDVEPLEPPETWEVVISEKGNNEEAWREVLPKMGLFAKIRNLRNMLECGIPGEDILGDEDMEHVENSKIFPFRFYQAWKAIRKPEHNDRFFLTGVGSLTEPPIDEYTEDWLSKAIDIAGKNIPDNITDSFVAVDVSGSMENNPVSQRSNLTLKEIATLFGAILKRRGAPTCVFADDVAPVNIHKDTPTLEIMRKINHMDVGGSTNGWKAIELLLEDGIEVERIIYLTDMQIWDSTGWRSNNSVKMMFNEYKRIFADTKLYMIDLNSYGDLTHPEGHEDVFNISGWNSKIIEFIQRAENPRGIIKEIEDF